jgi:hypothetical protein
VIFRSGRKIKERKEERRRAKQRLHFYRGRKEKLK